MVTVNNRYNSPFLMKQRQNQKIRTKTQFENRQFGVVLILDDWRYLIITSSYSEYLNVYKFSNLAGKCVLFKSFYSIFHFDFFDTDWYFRCFFITLSYPVVRPTFWTFFERCHLGTTSGQLTTGKRCVSKCKFLIVYIFVLAGRFDIFAS